MGAGIVKSTSSSKSHDPARATVAGLRPLGTMPASHAMNPRTRLGNQRTHVSHDRGTRRRRDRYQHMVRTFVLIMAIAASPSATNAQTKNSPTAGPFGTEWAKPSSQTGGYIHNDPRLKDPSSSSLGQRDRTPVCPPGRTFSVGLGRCR